MSDMLELAQHIAQGALMATVDGVDYRAVHLVAYLDENAAPRIYCPTEQWRQSPIGKLAERDMYIAELETTNTKQADELLRQRQQLVELERQLAETPRDNQERMFARQHTDSPPHTTRVKTRVVCGIEGCTELCVPGPQMRSHRKKTHPAWYSEQFVLPEDDPRKVAVGGALPIALHDDEPRPIDGAEPPWSCASCKSNVFAPSVRDPSLCQRCARNAQAVGSSGQAVAA
jgi:hypothetical protein